MIRKQPTEKTLGDIAYEHAVEVCNRLISELDKEMERCTVQETTATP